MYIDLVLCQHSPDGKPYLFVAPAWSYLKSGDSVLVETRCGLKDAVVVDCITEAVESEYIKFAVACVGASLPLKRVMSKITYKDFDYTEDKKEDNNEHLSD